MSGILKNIIVAIICIACAGLGYYLFIDGGSDSGVSSNSVVRQELVNKTQSFIERSARLQQVNIDQSFFTDSTFTSLRSFSAPVPNQPLGRNDIFGTATGITSGAVVETDQ